MQLFTIGYEGRDPAELVAILAGAGITRVIDVRALPLSRRPGFSKTPLQDALAAVGIDYVHLREAGNPHRKSDDPLGGYRAYLADSPAVVAAVLDAAEGHKAALLCVEHDPSECHRSILAAAARRKKRGIKIVDL
jgi:uncharacterized protein (DUF488 family)